MRLILLLKVFQSIAESAPVVVLLASHSENVVHETESQFQILPIEKLPLLSVSITSHCSLSERTFPFPVSAVELLLSWINLSPESPPVPALISNFDQIDHVPIPRAFRTLSQYKRGDCPMPPPDCPNRICHSMSPDILFAWMPPVPILLRSTDSIPPVSAIPFPSLTFEAAPL